MTSRLVRGAAITAATLVASTGVAHAKKGDTPAPPPAVPAIDR